MIGESSHRFRDQDVFVAFLLGLMSGGNRLATTLSAHMEASPGTEPRELEDAELFALGAIAFCRTMGAHLSRLDSLPPSPRSAARAARTDSGSLLR